MWPPIAATNIMTQINSSELELNTPFIVGIDLGTTNCAVAYYERGKAHPSPQIFRIARSQRTWS